MTLTRTCAALSAALLLAGCGGSSSSGGAGAAPTKDKATAAAKAINLVAGDVPAEYAGKPADTSDSTKNEQREFLACAGASTEDNSLVDVDSDDFTAGQAPAVRTVSSNVTVVPDEKTAAADVAAFRSAKAGECLKTSFDKVLKEQAAGQGVTFAPLKVATLAADAPGTDGAFGFTITTTVMAAGLSIPVTIELKAFLLKHTEVSLTTIGIAQPVAADVRDAAFTKLVERATKSAV